MDDGIEELSYYEKQKLPAELLFDPVESRAAAYATNHGLLIPLASKKLIAFAQAHTALTRPWDESKWQSAGHWYPMPEWATAEVRARCVLLAIERGDDDAYWRSIPKK